MNHRMPWAMCRVCGYLVDTAEQLEDDSAMPEPGDITLCVQCGAISAFDEHLGLRAPTIEEYDQALAQRETQGYLMAIWISANMRRKEADEERAKE